MALEDDLEKLKEATLPGLRLKPVKEAKETFKVVATLPPGGPREESLDEPMRGALAANLAARANEAVVKEAKAKGRRPLGFLNPKVGYDDDQAGERCYFIVLDIATA